nr:glycosyltransferase [Thermoleophilaceae bacterium]
ALEAMAAGLPVIASRTGALPETVGPERCVPRKDPRALATAMTALWEDPGRREREGAIGIDRARGEFGRERFTERILALYAGMDE